MGAWMGDRWEEEEEAVRVSYCELWVGGWVGREREEEVGGWEEGVPGGWVGGSLSTREAGA